jgi:hypothetical protein
MSDIAERVREVLSADTEEFRDRARADAEVVKNELSAGTFDNHQSIVGLEYEFYAVADDRWGGGDGTPSLARVPRRLLGLIGFEKELGLHNAEMTTSPQPMNKYGLAAQEAGVRANLLAALECTRAEGVRLVSDGMWTLPPAGESARDYLQSAVDDDGIRIATNMSDSVRYHAMSNGAPAPDSVAIDAPHVSLEATTVMPESLITSIQPHYQMSQAEDLPLYHNYALRVAGPLLALAVNSPFFPPDLYDEAPAEEILAEAHHENRIAVFESVMNRPDAKKVRFPQDLETVAEAVDRVADDPTIVPMPETAKSSDRFDDEFATLRLKHGTFWRWVRPVFDGPDRSGANARVEFRPLPAQPTVRDVIAFTAALGGLLESLPRREHPVINLDWEVAKDNFYAAARDGIGSEQHWITNDGQATSNPTLVYEDLLSHAAAGLRSVGLSAAEAEEYLAPLRHRVESRWTPADWKREIVEERVHAGDSLAEAIGEMQRRYVVKQSETLIEGTFSDWDRRP